MSARAEQIKILIDECSTEELRAISRYIRSLSPHPLETAWGIDADTILNAIRRSSDLTKRGVRGIIAEAVFESSVLPDYINTGWAPTTILSDLSYDVEISKGTSSVKIQIKLQRMEKGIPKLYYPKRYSGVPMYVVEVQKTRSGKKKTISSAQKEQTRPYRFGDFDILAVSMHPSSGQWDDFRYTVGSWLIPRKNDPRLIEIMQPVSAVPNGIWTDCLGQCIEWLQSGERRSVSPLS